MIAMNATRLANAVQISTVGRRLGIALALTTLVASCGDKPQQRGAPPPPAVTVAQPTKRTVTDFDEYVGRFVAVNSVEVRARVSGYLEGVHFTDGTNVKQGDLLFTIDKRPFQNAVAQARATLTQAKSNLAFTEADFTRGQQLVKEKTITDQLFQQRSQAYRNAQAAVAGAEAAVRTAELDLSFTELRAPINGRIGDRRVSPGNLVTGGNTGNTTLLATIVTDDPIHFEFTFDEASFQHYNQMFTSDADRGVGLPVSLKLVDEKEFSHTGKLDFVDNVISTSTGTIRGRALFSNPKGMFTPGMFARVRVPASKPYEALLVPDVAIGSEQSRKFVLAIDKDNTARAKYVTLGHLEGKLRVIKSGLAADDRIVVNGLARTRSGQKVRISNGQGGAPGGKPGAAGGKPTTGAAGKTK